MTTNFLNNNLTLLLEHNFLEFNNRQFIKDDPISIPHKFTQLQDIEISAFWTAMLAWGRRKTIIQKCTLLFELMDNAPYDFIVNHEENDLKRFTNFKHRTFNLTDTLYFIEFFKEYYKYKANISLETAFTQFIASEDITIEKALIGFHNLFCSLPTFPNRTRKHIATPARKSACKRLCMFLRWMVRKDTKGVDFGLWSKIRPNQLICPLDVHVDRIARRYNLIKRKQRDWKTAIELTNNLRHFDHDDPVKYDFALFGIGIQEQTNNLIIR